MAEITAGAVRELREKTGAGMMDCKKALEETQGNMEEAISWLRKKGAASAAKRAGRAASEGVIAATVKGNVGVLVEVNCETDFVARNEDFQNFIGTIVNHIADKAPGYVRDDAKPEGATGDALYNQPFEGGSNVGQIMAEQGGKIGENIQVARFARFEATGPAVLQTYIHSNAKLGVLVELGLSSADLASNDDVQTFANDLALHIAAESPLYLKREEAPTDTLDKEKDIARTAAIQSGKPENVVDKIVQGKIEKYYQETVLLEQAFFREQKKTITQLLAEKGKAAGGTLQINRFVRFVLGESAQQTQTEE